MLRYYETHSKIVIIFLINHLQSGLIELNSETKKSLEQTIADTSRGTNLIYSLIIFSRDQIKFYTGVFEKRFPDEGDLTESVVNVLYELLMKDTKLLCENYMSKNLDISSLNLNLVALAYDWTSLTWNILEY